MKSFITYGIILGILTLMAMEYLVISAIQISNKEPVVINDNLGQALTELAMAQDCYNDQVALVSWQGRQLEWFDTNLGRLIGKYERCCLGMEAVYGR